MIVDFIVVVITFLFGSKLNNEFTFILSVIIIIASGNFKKHNIGHIDVNKLSVYQRHHLHILFNRIHLHYYRDIDKEHRNGL